MRHLPRIADRRGSSRRTGHGCCTVPGVGRIWPVRRLRHNGLSSQDWWAARVVRPWARSSHHRLSGLSGPSVDACDRGGTSSRLLALGRRYAIETGFDAGRTAVSAAAPVDDPVDDRRPMVPAGGKGCHRSRIPSCSSRSRKSVACPSTPERAHRLATTRPTAIHSNAEVSPPCVTESHCKGVPAEPAKRICRSCPVQFDCLEVRCPRCQGRGSRRVNGRALTAEHRHRISHRRFLPN